MHFLQTVGIITYSKNLTYVYITYPLFYMVEYDETHSMRDRISVEYISKILNFIFQRIFYCCLYGSMLKEGISCILPERKFRYYRLSYIQDIMVRIICRTSQKTPVFSDVCNESHYSA
jgi:hypothetical protein